METSQQAKGGKSAGLILVLIIMVAFFFLGPMLMGSLVPGMSASTQTGEEFLLALNRGDAEGAYAMTAFSFRKVVDLEDLELLSTYPALEGYKSISWTGMTATDFNSEVNGVITTTDGEEYPARFEFVLEDEEWKVKYVNVHISLGT